MATDVDHKKFLLFPSIFPSHSVDISFWLHRRSSSSSKRKMRRKQPKKGGNSLKRKLKSSRCKTIYWNFSTSQLSTNGQVTFFNFSLPLKDFWVLKYYCTHTLVKLSKIVWGGSSFLLAETLSMYVVYISGGVTMTCLDMSFTPIITRPGGLKL